MAWYDPILANDAFDFLSDGALDRIGFGGPAEPVATGASALTRQEALTLFTLAAAPRLIERVPGEAWGLQVPQGLPGEADYVILATFEDPATGFRAVQMRSAGQDVFAIDPVQTQSGADILAALDLARPQAQSAAFAGMVAAARDAALTGHEIAFTGASLGGGLAQAAGHQAAVALLAADPGWAGVVTTFGIDGIGGREAAEALHGGALDPAALARMNALNIRTEGDVVSRIAGQIGGTITFDAVDSAGQPVPLDPLEAHVNVESLLATLNSEALWQQGVRGAPDEAGFAVAIADDLGPAAARLYDDLGLAAAFDLGGPGELPGLVAISPEGPYLDLDADANGTLDLRLGYTPEDPLIA